MLRSEDSWRKGNPCALLVGMWSGAATMENSMEGPPKTKYRATIWSCNPTPGRVSGGNENTDSNVHSSTVSSSEEMEATEVSISTWMDKDVAHIYNGILLSHKRKWNWVIEKWICSEVDGLRDCHTEWSKSEREKQICADRKSTRLNSSH